MEKNAPPESPEQHTSLDGSSRQTVRNTVNQVVENRAGIQTASSKNVVATIGTRESQDQHPSPGGYSRHIARNTAGRGVENQAGIKEANIRTASSKTLAASLEAAGKLKGTFSRQEDAATRTVGQMVGTGFAAYATYKGVKKFTPTLIKTGKGIYQVGDTTVKAVKTITNVAGAYKNEFITNGIRSQFRRASRLTGLDRTQLSKYIISQTQKIQGTINGIKHVRPHSFFIGSIKKTSFCALHHNKKIFQRGLVY